MKRKTIKYSLIVIFVFLAVSAFAQNTVPPKGAVTIDLGTLATKQGLADNIQLLLVLTVLTLAPSIIVLMTSFTRIVIVFHFLRQAMGTNQVPSSQILVAIALVMTFFIMAPTFNEINKIALIPLKNKQISADQAFEKMVVPMKKFMLKQTRKKDIGLFLKMSKKKRPVTKMDIELSVLVPAFIISELKTAFEIGFFIFIPFLIIDMVVASVLLSMGMMMLPPVLVSLPFKILLFVMVDGWYLIIDSLLRSFQ
jgi:flagellar biosynthetic protein FliP